MSAGDKYFQGNPVRLDVSRSRFPLNHNWRGTLNAGRWVPFYTQEVLAGDTFKLDANLLLRSSKPASVVMDDATVSVEFFFVPFDLLLSRAYMTPSTSDSNRSWRAFFGAQDALLNMPTPAEYKLPSITVTDTQAAPYKVGGLLDCLGIPKPQGGTGYQYDISCLKVLAYYAVWSEYMRDPNVMSPVTYQIVTSSGKDIVSASYNPDAGITAAPFSAYECAPACANHGYFGSALPWPQRNSTSVTLPLGDVAPVITGDEQSLNASYWQGKTALKFRNQGNGQKDNGLSLGLYYGNAAPGSSDSSITGGGEVPTNLYADLSNATAATINTLRAAFATQRWYEELARSGNRYDEMIQGMFGVTPPVKGLKPEYLGGKDIPLGMQQVNGTGDNNLGVTGAFSETFDRGHYFSKSFTEPGIIIGMMAVRTRDSFAQGVDAFDLKRDRFSFYWPQFANTGEVGIKKSQLYVKGSTAGGFDSVDEEIFGYQEYAADYRYHPDVVTGYFRPDVSNGLAYWTYVNNFATHPTLKGFLEGGDRFKSNVDQTLAVKSTAAGFQFFGMVHLDVVAVRPMPLHSIPGLLDHH